MKTLQIIKKWLIVLMGFGLVVWIFGFNWSFVFKKRVIGEVVAAERVNTATVAVVSNSQEPLNSQVFSFSVGIKNPQTGEIYMASSEDRQWAAVQKGNCVVAVYFPYPPWQLSKASTSHNARLLKNFTSCEQMPSQDSVWESIKFFFLLS